MWVHYQVIKYYLYTLACIIPKLLLKNCSTVRAPGFMADPSEQTSAHFQVLGCPSEGAGPRLDKHTPCVAWLMIYKVSPGCVSWKIL